MWILVGLVEWEWASLDDGWGIRFVRDISLQEISPSSYISVIYLHVNEVSRYDDFR